MPPTYQDSELAALFKHLLTRPLAVHAGEETRGRPPGASVHTTLLPDWWRNCRRECRWRELHADYHRCLSLICRVDNTFRILNFFICNLHIINFLLINILSLVGFHGHAWKATLL